MTTFVLVHGAWHGGWCWRDVARILRRDGHEVHTPTLTGLGDRVHLQSPEVGLSVHIEDVVNTIEFENLRNVVLCGHSYGGMVITGVADRIPERLAAIVYLDALVPEDGNCVFDLLLPDRAETFRRDAKSLGDGWLIPAVSAEFFGVTDPQAQTWVDDMCVPMAIRAFEEPIHLNGRQWEVQKKAYILAGAYQPSSFQVYHARFKDDPDWQVHTLPCGHDAMVVLPQELSGLLTGIL